MFCTVQKLCKLLAVFGSPAKSEWMRYHGSASWSYIRCCPRAGHHLSLPTSCKLSTKLVAAQCWRWHCIHYVVIAEHKSECLPHTRPSEDVHTAAWFEVYFLVERYG